MYSFVVAKLTTGQRFFECLVKWACLDLLAKSEEEKLRKLSCQTDILYVTSGDKEAPFPTTPKPNSRTQTHTHTHTQPVAHTEQAYLNNHIAQAIRYHRT